MSVRYFVISSLLVIGLSVVIGIFTDKRSVKEIAVIICWVAAGLAAIAGVVYGVSKLLVYWGIAESGFVI